VFLHIIVQYWAPKMRIFPALGVKEFQEPGFRVYTRVLSSLSSKRKRGNESRRGCRGRRKSSPKTVWKVIKGVESLRKHSRDAERIGSAESRGERTICARFLCEREHIATSKIGWVSEVLKVGFISGQGRIMVKIHSTFVLRRARASGMTTKRLKRRRFGTAESKGASPTICEGLLCNHPPFLPVPVPALLSFNSFFLTFTTSHHRVLLANVCCSHHSSSISRLFPVWDTQARQQQ
jgi:hypothetical protein